MVKLVAPRVVFLGMDSEFSTVPLLALLESGVHVAAVVKPLGGTALRHTNLASRVPGFMARLQDRVNRWMAGPPPVSLLVPPPLDPFTVAQERGIPCCVVGDASGSRALSLLRRFSAQVFCVAFFNQLLRPKVLALPTLGAINLHPSLLPAYRGPAPLFWTFKDAVRETGVTLHKIAPGEDDGDILSQAVLPVPDGTRGPALVTQMAHHGAELMVKGVWDLFGGQARPVPQDTSRAFRRARPAGEDLRVKFDRPARDVFNFVRGVCDWVPLHAQFGEDRVDVLDAQHFDTHQTLPGEWAFTGNTVLVRCAVGLVALRIRGPLARASNSVM